METAKIQHLEEALAGAGLEIYRASDGELRIAERVRLHLMDSGVRVTVDDGLAVQFTARAQRSDAPSARPDELFARVRQQMSETVGSRGYRESGAEIVEIKDPVDETTVLDVWHEVTYQKPLERVAEAVEEIRWALDLEKYVRP